MKIVKQIQLKIVIFTDVKDRSMLHEGVNGVPLKSVISKI